MTSLLVMRRFLKYNLMHMIKTFDTEIYGQAAQTIAWMKTRNGNKRHNEF